MDNEIWMNCEAVQDDQKLSFISPGALPFQYDFNMWEESLFESDLMQGGFYSNPFYYGQDHLQDEFAELLDDNNIVGKLDDMFIDESMMKEEDHRRIAQQNIKGENTKINKQNPFQDDFCKLDGDNGLWDAIIIDASMLKEENRRHEMIIDSRLLEEEDRRIEQHNTKGKLTMNMITKQNHSRSAREGRVLTFEEVSQYFYMPIIQAAKELNVGLTLLKKRCRELGIPRWPHRTMKSMQTLIKNVQELELGIKDGSVGDTKSEIEKLKEEQMLMEKWPLVEMQKETKRRRQQCFKAKYKKRKILALAEN